MFAAPHAFLTRIVRNFGLRFAVALASVYVGVLGAAFTLVQIASLAYFKGLGVPSDRYQSFSVAIQSPWTFKSLIGLLSDTLPLHGFHKRSYLLIVSILGTIALLTLAFLRDPLPTAASSTVSISSLVYIAPVALLTLFSAQAATTDLLSEAAYARLMAERPHTGSDIVAYKFLLLSLGNILGAAIAGPLADASATHAIFLIAAPLAAQAAITPLMGWFPEIRLPPEQRGFRVDKLHKHAPLVRFIAVMSAGAALVAGASFCADGTQAIVSITVLPSLIIAGVFLLPRTLLRVNMYLMLHNVLRLDISAAMDYYYTASSSCVPNGPAFTYTFYSTFATIVGNAATLVGIALFQRYLSGGTYRRAMVVTTVLKIGAAFFDLAVVTRFGARFGISDRVLFTLGDAVAGPLVEVLNVMPAVVLTSKSCPRGMEASVYALLVSFGNLGSSISRTLGDELFNLLRIRSVTPCDFSRLPVAIVIASIALPALIIPLIFFLIPDARMTDVGLGDNDDSTGVDDAVRAAAEAADVEAGVADGAKTTGHDGQAGLLDPADPAVDVEGDGDTEVKEKAEAEVKEKAEAEVKEKAEDGGSGDEAVPLRASGEATA